MGKVTVVCGGERLSRGRARPGSLATWLALMVLLLAPLAGCTARDMATGDGATLESMDDGSGDGGGMGDAESQDTETGEGGISAAVPGDGACCADGDCVCRGGEPSETFATSEGPFETSSYAMGFRDGPDFLGATIYYPTDAEPPLSGVVLCPGFTALQNSIAGWGPFFASHGIVTMVIDTNTPLVPVSQRDDALLDALASLKAENTRMDSPLFDQLSADRFGLGGWSMGGGGTWLATQAHPELKTGMTLAGHHATAGGSATVAKGIEVPTILFAGAMDTNILGGGQQSQQAYAEIPETTPKILYEFGSAGHFAFGTPLRTGEGALGRYGLAFQKVFLEGDERYRQLILDPGPDVSDWMSNVE